MNKSVQSNLNQCDPKSLDALLKGQLPSVLQQQLEQHLSVCSDCVARIESMAVLDSSWNATKSMLEIDEFDGQGSLTSLSSLYSSVEPLKEFEELLLPLEHDSMTRTQTIDVLTREIKGWLDPTDDPHSLGRFAGYEIVGIVGHGGMGIVLKGFENSLHRYVAIKVLAPRLATNGSARLRFAREAQATAAVRHDNVIAIHRVDDWHGLPFLVMPYITGISLQKRIDSDGAMSIEQALRVGIQIASGLAAAHTQGLVHRDIKPANILLEQGVERVTITDFGLARAVDDASVTRTGIIAGTPQYMSPEQAQAGQIDARSDLFSLGSVLYTAVTGRPPFRGASSFEVLQKIVHRQPRQMREIEPSVPVWFQQIVSKLHSKNPSDRPASASEVAALLEECLAHVRQPTISALPKSLPQTSSRFGMPPSWTYRWIAIGLMSFALLLGIFIMIETNKGQLTIESDSDNVPIRIVKGDQIVDRLTMTQTPKTIRIAAGQYAVEIDGDYEGVAIENSKISLSRGGVEKVKIVLQPKETELEAPSKEYNDVYKKEIEAARRYLWTLQAQTMYGGAGGGPSGTSLDMLGYYDSWIYKDFKSDQALVDAVAAFNRIEVAPGYEQPPVTVAEVITCASWNLLYGEKLSPTATEGLRRIAQHRQWPTGWSIKGGFAKIPIQDFEVSVYRVHLFDEKDQPVLDVRLRCLAPPDEFQQPTQEPTRPGKPLREAIAMFNASHSSGPGTSQPELTVNEVIASILYNSSQPSKSPLSESTLKMYEEIAKTHVIPDGCELELLTNFGPNDGVTHSIWSIRLRVPYLDKPNHTYAFTIRDQYLAVTHGDAESIHWGQPAENGLQAGVRLSPGLKTYDIGQKIDVEIYYRNIYTTPLKGSLPNFFTCEAIEANDIEGRSLKFIDRTNREIVGGWFVTSFGENPQEVRGPSFIIQTEAESTSEPVSDLDSIAANGESFNESILIAEPGQTCQMRFRVSNYAESSNSDLETGYVEFKVNER